MKKLLLFSSLLFWVPIFAQTPFDCDDGRFYQVISNELKAFDPVTSTYTDIGIVHSTTFNSGGYNTVDDFLYAEDKNNKLIRIGSDGITDLGLIDYDESVYGTWYANADIDSNGDYWAFLSAYRQKNMMLKINDLASYDGTQPIDFEYVLMDTSVVGAIVDVVFIDGLLYGVNKSSTLYTFDVSTTPVTVTSASVANLPVGSYGAGWSDSAGRLYVSNNAGGLWLIEGYMTANPIAVYMGSSEVTNQNDGFKCAVGASPLDKDKMGF